MTRRILGFSIYEWIGLVLAACVLLAGLYDVFFYVASSRWTGEVSGKVLKVESISRNTSGNTSGGITPDMECQYSYKVDGVAYKGTWFRPGHVRAGVSLQSTYEDYKDKYVRGHEVTVHFSPNRPSWSYLERTFPFWPILFVLGGVAGLSYLFWQRRFGNQKVGQEHVRANGKADKRV